jgi:3-oxoacyl-[acyl-carrier protein] reductase
MYEDLKGKVAIVTGAGRDRGFGRAIAVTLAQDGANVVVADISQEFKEYPGYGVGDLQGLEETARRVREAGGQALPIVADVTDKAAVEAMVAKALENFGRIDILVNNAGGSPGVNLAALMEEDAWNKTMAINLTGTFLCSQAVVRHMAERGGGKVVNMASEAALRGGIGQSAYAAAKAGIVAFTRVLAKEVAQHKIHVNAIGPGVMDTELQRWGWRVKSFVYNRPYEQVVEEETKRIPIGRLGTPEDVANLVAFLSSSQSDFITGEVIYITGGT